MEQGSRRRSESQDPVPKPELGPFDRSPTLLQYDERVPVTVLGRSSNTGDFPASESQAQPETPAVDQGLSEPLLSAIQPVPKVVQADHTPDLDAKLHFAYNLSWVVNILLFVAKAYAYWSSSSKAVLASLVDSLVDLVSQAVIFIAEWRSKDSDPRYPVGKARLETIGVLACACIMSVSAYVVVQDSGMALYEGWAHDQLPGLDASLMMYVVLGSATGLKLICYVLCVALRNRSDSMLALAEDHLNDVVSNVGAIITAAVASQVEKAWWADPVGGIAISLFILYRWYDIARNQLDKIVGRGAPEELLDQLKSVAAAHHAQLELDCLRAYYFGSRYMVEAEVVMPEDSTLKEVHDISLQLQHKLEALEQVERCFVHVDYTRRPEPEHRTDRLLAGLPVISEEELLRHPSSGPIAAHNGEQHSFSNGSPGRTNGSADNV